MSNPQAKAAEKAQQKAKRKRIEMVVLLLLLLPVGCGAVLLGRGLMPTPGKSAPNTLSAHFGSPAASSLQVAATAQGNPGLPLRGVPAGYQAKGTVDDQYTVATDPKTGEMLINDALGGIGSNNTSVEGDRVQLATDMLNLDAYAEENKHSLSLATYSWMKQVARMGMQMAFGVPGMPAAMQPAIKPAVLAQLHAISTDPAAAGTVSPDNMAGMIAKLQDAYTAADPASATTAGLNPSGGTLLSKVPIYPTPITNVTMAPTVSSPVTAANVTPTPTSGIKPVYTTVSPTLTTNVSPVSTTTSPTTLDYTGSGTLSGTLSTATLTPPPTALMAPQSSYNYIPVATVAPTPTTTVATTTAPKSTTATVTPVANTTTSPTSTATASPTTVDSLYQTTFGTSYTPTTTTTSTATPTTAQSPSVAPATATTTTSSPTINPTITPTSTTQTPTNTLSNTTQAPVLVDATGTPIDLNATTTTSTNPTLAAP